MLGNFNGNFDQWLIRAADKSPYEKKKSSIMGTEILSLSDTEKGYKEKEGLPTLSPLKISALFHICTGDGNKISKTSGEDSKEQPQILKGYNFLPRLCCCIEMLKHQSS